MPLFPAIQYHFAYTLSGEKFSKSRMATTLCVFAVLSNQNCRFSSREARASFSFLCRLSRGITELKADSARLVYPPLSTAHFPTLRFPSSFNLPDPPGVCRFLVFFPRERQEHFPRNRIESRRRKMASAASRKTLSRSRDAAGCFLDPSRIQSLRGRWSSSATPRSDAFPTRT